MFNSLPSTLIFKDDHITRNVVALLFFSPAKRYLRNVTECLVKFFGKEISPLRNCLKLN